MRHFVAVRHLAVLDAAAGGHPLHVAGAQDTVSTGVILMFESALKNECHCLHAAMRMRFKPAWCGKPVFR